MLKAPIDGVIIAFDLRARMNIAKDGVVVEIQDTDPVWVTAAIPESTVWLMKNAPQFMPTIPARPDKTLAIRRWTLLPGVDAATHTLQLHLEVNNADEVLEPGTNVRLQLSTAGEPMLPTPSQALIDTDNGQRVITVDAGGRFVLKRVAIFQASQGITVLRSNLAEGEKVVSSGLLLIDSEADISGTPERMRSKNATYVHRGNSQ